jgi:adenosine deaminase
MVNAFSMRNFLPSAAARSRHDQFFATFDRFSASASSSTPEMVVNQLRHYASETVQYVVLMVSFLSGDDRRALAQGLSGKTDFPAMLETVRKNGLDRMIAAERDQVAQLVEAVDKLLGCGAAREAPGCQVDYRFIVQVSRNNPPEEVFAQTAAAAALIRADPRVVGLNFVQPEDYLRARQDYSLQMRMVQFLASDVPVSLHAGELWLGLVPPSDLTFHIREAVTVAGARRIGHGVSLAFEGDMSGLLAEMRRRRVAVEINLTSNDVILGVRGEDHPLRTYLAAGVPVVPSTDDAGVSCIDLTNEYVRATREHGLDYYALKTVAHNALQYSFLDEAEKEKELKSLDRSFTAFEAGTAEEFSPLVRFRKFLCGCR